MLQYVGWEWIFLINVPIGAVALLMGWRLLPYSNGATSSRLDLIGLLLLSPALAALIFGISEIRTVADLGSAAVLIPLAASLVLLVAFVVRSLRINAPLLDLRLFQGRTFSAAAVTTFGLGAATFGAVFLVPLYFQQVRDTSVLVTGLLTTPQAVGMAVSMTLAGRLADKIGAGTKSHFTFASPCQGTPPSSVHLTVTWPFRLTSRWTRCLWSEGSIVTASASQSRVSVRHGGPTATAGEPVSAWVAPS